LAELEGECAQEIVVRSSFIRGALPSLARPRGEMPYGVGEPIQIANLFPHLFR
jgi:hypothetical protein